MSSSGLTPYQEECLLILQEECAETIQEICKIKRFGINENSHHTEGKTHLECLIQELGDLMCCINLVIDAEIGITCVGLEEASTRKTEKLKTWMKHSK